MESTKEKTNREDKKPNQLENTLQKPEKSNIFYYNAKNQTLTQHYNKTVNYYKPKVSHTSLPKGTWGQYNTLTHSIEIGNGISADQSTFTSHHEKYHSIGGTDE